MREVMGRILRACRTEDRPASEGCLCGIIHALKQQTALAMPCRRIAPARAGTRSRGVSQNAAIADAVFPHIHDEGMYLHSCGGRLSHSNRNCLLGSDAQDTFSQMHADIAFFSAKALSKEGVIWDCDREEVCLRQSILQNAGKRVFLCASEKFPLQPNPFLSLRLR